MNSDKMRTTSHRFFAPSETGTHTPAVFGSRTPRPTRAMSGFSTPCGPNSGGAEPSIEVLFKNAQ